MVEYRKVGKPERRYREGSGVKTLVSSDRMRCHALSSGAIQRYREDTNDYTTPSEELWPQCQCPLGAVPGHFVCRFHGGLSPRTKNPPRSLVDVLPLDLAEKFAALYNNPDYISRKDDILLLQSRVWQLLERLEEEAGSAEAWDYVNEALVCIQSGDERGAIDYLSRALEYTRAEKDIWQEVRETERLIKDMTNTQVRSAKELQAMATTEEISLLINGLVDVIVDGAKEYIPNGDHREIFVNRVIRRIEQLTNTGSQAIIGRLASGN